MAEGHTGMGLAGRVGRVLNRKVLPPLGLQLVRAATIHGPSSATGVSDWSARLWSMRKQIEPITDVKGDFVEAGIYWGHGLLIMLHILAGWGQARRIVGYDSFGGHPAAHEKDLSGPAAERLEGHFVVSEGDVWRTLELGTGSTKAEIAKQVTIVPGWFKDTMRGHAGDIAFLHLDPDYYESTRDALAALWPRIVPGGIVFFGRRNNPNLPGKGQALSEFSASNADVEFLTDPTGNCSCLTKRRA